MSIEKAKAIYSDKKNNKFNCGQAVMAAFKEKFSVDESLLKLFSGYGSGRAPEGECGAYYAVKHLLSGVEDDRVKLCEAAFKERGGSTKCKEIRQGRKLSCIGCVETAAEFLEKAEKRKLLTGDGARVHLLSPQKSAELAGTGKGVKFIDVSSPFEFNAMHIKDSVNIPLEMLGAKAEELIAAGDTYIIVCKTGARSSVAAEALSQAGVKMVYVMDGGIAAWHKKGFSVIKGDSGLSLERQVRIIAGAIVTFGILAAIFIHPAFIALSLFVGCGLMYAGITDNCLMGVLLMKLPYNKKLYKIDICPGSCSIDR